ncbi:MAG: BMC domain-containing protein, partial [Candidatus Aminicenantes bacterium]|nr:BMC domain-containing protein [Candidatus Aminicenantes bacterium]
IETRSVPSVIRAADSGIKGADVDIIEIRMADDLGGKGIVIFTGKLEEVETAINISKVALAENGSIVDITIIPRPVGETSDQINTSTSFKDSVAVSVRDGEQ